MHIFPAIDLSGGKVARLERGKHFFFVAWILPVALLLGCASTPPPITNPAVEEHPVVGVSEGEQNRTTINATDQQIYNTEHSDTGSPSPAPVTPTTGIP